MSRDESPLVRDPTTDEGYTYMHRAFLQSFLTHAVLTFDEIKPILAHVMTAQDPTRPWSPGDVTQPFLTSTLQTINAALEPYDLEIRSSRSQHTKLQHYALVNKTSDLPTQLATKHSAAEIAYIRRVLDYMFDTNNTTVREVLAIKHAEASQLARVRRNRQSQATQIVEDGVEGATQISDPGISIQEADDLLTSLVQESFLQKSNKGYYSLAPRALMELRAYLKETYNEPPSGPDADDAVVRIHDCEGCREIVTHGVRCNNRECGVRWHDACANGFYRGRREGGRGCPKCGAECGGDVYVGERADRVGRQQARQSVVEAEEDEEEDDDEM